MKAVVFGYQEIGYICLEELVRFGVDVACLFTHEDDPGEEIWFRRPMAIAKERGIPVYTPESLRDEHWVDVIRDTSPDFIFSFYYRYMIPPSILQIPRVAALNLHGSLLPKFRGRAPVNWVLVKGEHETGVTLHEMLEKPDAGNIIAQEKVGIDFEDDVNTLYVKMSEAARRLMVGILPKLADGTFVRSPQVGPSTYFGGRKPQDGLIMWQQDAMSIYNLTRAVTHPYPGAFTFLDGRKLFVWKSCPRDDAADGGFRRPGEVVSSRPFLVKAGKGLVELERVQWEDAEEMDGADFGTANDLENKSLGGGI